MPGRRQGPRVRRRVAISLSSEFITLAAQICRTRRRDSPRTLARAASEVAARRKKQEAGQGRMLGAEGPPSPAAAGRTSAAARRKPHAACRASVTGLARPAGAQRKGAHARRSLVSGWCCWLAVRAW